jgi:hypothetical protein
MFRASQEVDLEQLARHNVLNILRCIYRTIGLVQVQNIPESIYVSNSQLSVMYLSWI